MYLALNIHQWLVTQQKITYRSVMISDVVCQNSHLDNMNDSVFITYLQYDTHKQS